MRSFDSVVKGSRRGIGKNHVRVSTETDYYNSMCNYHDFSDDNFTNDLGLRSYLSNILAIIQLKTIKIL